MSFDRYLDNVKRNRPVSNEALQPPPPVETPALAATDNTASESQSETKPALAAQEAQVATPTRPLNLPSLPGMNKGYSVQIDSTNDDDHQTAAPVTVINTEGDADIRLREQNWQNAAEAARSKALNELAEAAEEDSKPLNVRMSFLPNSKITPTEQAVRKRTKRTDLMQAANKPKTTAPKRDEPKTAECAAVDLYKKKQLQAIESDRQTLKALQSAIADLGLEKQLDFMSGSQQSPTLTAASDTPAAGATTPQKP